MQNTNSSDGASKRPEHTADSILAAFEDALSGTQDAKELLNAWTRRFPDLGPDFALAVTDHIVGSVAVSGQFGADAFEAQASRTVAGYAIPDDAPMAKPRQMVAAATLKECCRNAGMSFPEQLSAWMLAPAALLERLNRREIDPATIPTAFAADLASALQLGFADCVRMLRGSGGFATAIQEARTPYGRPASFDEALESTGDEDEQAYWAAKTAHAGRLGDESTGV
jgi:hypothetical protein